MMELGEAIRIVELSIMRNLREDYVVYSTTQRRQALTAVLEAARAHHRQGHPEDPNG